MSSLANLVDLIGRDSAASIEGDIVVNGARYLRLIETDEADSAGEKIVRLDENGVGTIIASSSVVYRSDVDPAVADGFDLPVAEPEETLPSAGGVGTLEATTATVLSSISIEQLAAMVFSGALAANQTLVSKDVPKTNNGRLACAWAVNTIVKRALGRPIGGQLSTANMVPILRHFHFPIAAEQKHAGCIIIAATAGGKTGHVGIVGDEDDIYSNSSNDAIFRKGPTLAKWKATYAPLVTEYFELNPLRFPEAELTA